MIHIDITTISLVAYFACDIGRYEINLTLIFHINIHINICYIHILISTFATYIDIITISLVACLAACGDTMLWLVIFHLNRKQPRRNHTIPHHIKAYHVILHNTKPYHTILHQWCTTAKRANCKPKTYNSAQHHNFKVMLCHITRWTGLALQRVPPALALMLYPYPQFSLQLTPVPQCLNAV